MATDPMEGRLVPEEALRRLAERQGLKGGAALALAEMERRRDAGEDPICVLHEDGTTSILDATERMGT